MAGLPRAALFAFVGPQGGQGTLAPSAALAGRVVAPARAGRRAASWPGAPLLSPLASARHQFSAFFVFFEKSENFNFSRKCRKFQLFQKMSNILKKSKIGQKIRFSEIHDQILMGIPARPRVLPLTSTPTPNFRDGRLEFF